MGDPGALTSLGNTPGCLGILDDSSFDVNRMIDPLDFDFLLKHHVLKSHLVESTQLRELELKSKAWKGKSIWKVAGAVVFRVQQLVEDLDGSPRAYHPPTDASWNGFGTGLGKDALPNAVSDPPVGAFAKSKNEKDWPLVAGCEVFRDLNTARKLEAKATAQAAAAKTPPANQAAAAQAAKEAKDTKDALDALYKKNNVTKFAELETLSKSAVCVKYVDGRLKADSRADWSHVVKWAGIQTDSSGKPRVRPSGPNKGFYIPAITPAWADAEVHPWVVLNPPQDSFGVNLTNNAVVIVNGDPPRVFPGMVADVGPVGHLGEVSHQMLDDLGFPGGAPADDYIVVQFAEPVSKADMAKAKTAAAIRTDAQAAFDAWTWEGRSGLDLIKELFPTPARYQQSQTDFAEAKKYLTPYLGHLTLTLPPR